MAISALAALMWTLIVEAPLAGVAGWRSGQPWKRIIAAGLLPSLLTHPLAWQAWSRLSPYDYAVGVTLIEAVVWLAEAVLLKMLLQLWWRRALLLSMVTNAASFALGYLFNH